MIEGTPLTNAMMLPSIDLGCVVVNKSVCVCIYGYAPEAGEQK